jgi:50S ribosomal subunit-associated GTPase HflX
VKQLESKIEHETRHTREKIAKVKDQLEKMSHIEDIKAKYESEKEVGLSYSIT